MQLISFRTLALGATMGILALIWSGFASARAQQSITETYREPAGRIIEEALANDQAFENLTYFVDTFGPRLSGSEALERSIDWLHQQMKEGDLDSAWTQQVMVPHWVRGEESATLLSPRRKYLPMLGLGGSIATPPEGITGEVLVVKSFEDLQQHADEARGKIVLFNAPFTSYGETVQYRVRGAIAAAKAGAVASLIRTVGSYSMQTPHAGVMYYEEGVQKIPHAAITVEDARLLQRFQDRGEAITVNLKMNARTLPDAPSRNVIAEIRGTEHPEQVVVMGGHIDSWDVGQGAMDDAGGCFAAWEALKLIRRLNLKPKRTIRVVMWTNEENGSRGGEGYHDQISAEAVQNHVLAIESDGGVFKPKGFGFSGSDDAFEMVSQIGNLLEPIESGEITRGGGGADIAPLMKSGVPGMGLRVDGTRYFWFHHSEADTIDKLNNDDFKRCVATMAVMAYVAADMPKTLPKMGEATH